ncbi:unnamed protein product [Psylliodes chrysocephalus]|uniref:Uncharacterized protein n=1 Tax=Psylliodes chrysocephalus TaxID=3402493 RepID=A0A9P0GG28_9CUCU|nr:unnamed protein product [Psylliodes chrysocephala]
MAQRRGIPTPSGIPGSRTRQLNLEEVPPCCQNQLPAQARPDPSGLRSQIQRPRSGLRPPYQQTRPGSSGLRQPSQSARPEMSIYRPPTHLARPETSRLRPPSQSARPGVSGLRPPAQSRLQQSFMRPPPSGQRSQSVPLPHASRINVTTTSRSGGQIPTRPALGVNSTMVGMDGSFVPRAASSRAAVETTQPRSFGFRGNVPPRQPNTSEISMIQRPGLDRRGAAQDSSIIARGAPTRALAKPTRVEKKVKIALLNESTVQPGKKVRAKAKTEYQVPKKLIATPAGREPILQQTVLEKRVERDDEGETVIKNVTISNLNESTGMMENVEMGIQEFDPQYRTTDSKELIGTTSTVSITPEFTTVTKDYQRATTTPIAPDIGISPHELSRLVEEEKEDVNNTLSMMPPDLLLEPGKYEIKHRLQQMRLNAESVALLEQSIIKPEVTADDAQEELSPEAIASVMYTVETGIKPESSPDQVFNSLFQESPNEHFIKLSSVTPGPLQDVVVPTEVPTDIHKEVISIEMTKLADRMAGADPENIPTTDIFNRVMEEAQKYPESGRVNPRVFPMIQDERSLWINANLEPLVNIVGAVPIDTLDPYNLDELEKSGNLESELMKGVEYFVETNPVQYVNRVQLRGSHSPSYFPGYMVAAPDLPDLIKIVKSPDEVFALGWKSVQPKYFEEEAMMSLLG